MSLFDWQPGIIPKSAVITDT